MIKIPIKKLCSWHGCSYVVEDNVKYCPAHKQKNETIERDRYKEYKQRRLKEKDQKKYQDFYNSKAWRMVRSNIISNCYSVDILEYYKTGNIIQGESVHHIEELDSNWSMRLDTGNLIYLTEQNHRRVHVEYDKGEREKKQMQDLLLGLLDRWNKEFGGLAV